MAYRWGEKVSCFSGGFFSRDCGLSVIREDEKLQWENNSVQKDLNSSHLKQDGGLIRPWLSFIVNGER